MEVYNNLWANRMEQKDSSYAHTLKIAFKQLMMRMFTSNGEMLSTIDDQANEYEVRGDSINTYIAISISWRWMDQSKY